MDIQSVDTNIINLRPERDLTVGDDCSRDLGADADNTVVH